jgi:hypothetical protein
MQLLHFLGVVACVTGVHSTPTMKSSGLLARADDDRGNETVSGLGSRKQEVISAGGNTRDLAIAMLETSVDRLLSSFLFSSGHHHLLVSSKTMTTDYTYGLYTTNVSHAS